MLINGIVILIIISAMVFIIYKYLKGTQNVYVPEDHVNTFSLEYLSEGIKNTFNSILKANLNELNLKREDMDKRKQNKAELRKSLKFCAYGDVASKSYLKEYIKDLLISKYHINEDNIHLVINFDNMQSLSIRDKFDILLHIYKKKCGYNALSELITEHKMNEPKYDENQQLHYEITKQDIENAFRSSNVMLTYEDKLNIVAQRIYATYKGYGVIDDIRDMKIDGVSGGVSGLPDESFDRATDSDIDFIRELPLSYDSVWIFFKGTQIHLSCLSFGSKRELERVVKNIYRYNNPGTLSEASGFLVSEMADGSRVSVARPPFCESWVFFVRKFDTGVNMRPEQLITDTHSDIPIKIIHWIVKGCQIIAVTGEQGSGKTTLLESIIGYLSPTLTLRIHELSFELHLRKLFPNRNIVTFKETGDVSAQAGLDFSKKTDGSVSILGEIASSVVSSLGVQMAQKGRTTMFTHHGKSTKSLIESIRNDLLEQQIFNNEKIAEEHVASTINLDIHLVKDEITGKRYIERITEIIPIENSLNYPEEYKKGNTFEEKLTKFLDNMNEYFYRQTDRKTYFTVDICSFENGQYVFKNEFSPKTAENIKRLLSKTEREEFESDLLKWGECKVDN